MEETSVMVRDLIPSIKELKTTGMVFRSIAIAGMLLPYVGVGFYMPWQLLVGAGVGVLGICLVSAFLSAIRIVRLEPAVVFKA